MHIVHYTVGYTKPTPRLAERRPVGKLVGFTVLVSMATVLVISIVVQICAVVFITNQSWCAIEHYCTRRVQ